MNEESSPSVKPSRARSLVFCLVLAGVLTVTLIAMIDYIGLEKVVQRLPFSEFTSVLFITGTFFAVVAVLALLVAKRGTRIIGYSRRLNPLSLFALSFNKKSIVIATVVIFACWIPYIVLQYPCAISADTYNQLYQFQTGPPTFYTTMGVYVDAEYIDHHPVFDTLLFGCFLWLGDVLGSQNNGLFLYSLFQCVLTATALSLSCCYLDRLGVPKVFRLLAFVFVALFPPIPLWATCMIKDSIFAAVFVFFFLIFIEVFLSKGKALRNTKFLVGFIAATGACILTKKSGVYIAVPSVIALLFVCRPEWKRVTIAAITPVLVFSLLLPALVYPAIGGVSRGGGKNSSARSINRLSLFCVAKTMM